MRKVFPEVSFLPVIRELELIYVNFINNNKIQLAKRVRERKKMRKIETGKKQFL